MKAINVMTVEPDTENLVILPAPAGAVLRAYADSPASPRIRISFEIDDEVVETEDLNLLFVRDAQDESVQSSALLDANPNATYVGLAAGYHLYLA